ncbi:MAG: gliding motility protein GldN [Bacteroidaceae bacterium]|nr:gliding motility protein GldN [Bacteroidaceae bacterium]
MQYISRLLVIVSFLIAVQAVDAQPPARKKENAKKERKAENRKANTTLTERAKSQYPGTIVPQEVEWKRDVYRTLDLKVEENASLYYPVEQIGDNMNLFTFLFLNVIKGDITAYEYNLDGYESFTEEDIADTKEMLEDYRIYYEEKDGEIVVGGSDIPSAEVLSYYVKESHYYDNKTGTYSKRITALCPVLHRSDYEYSSQIVKYPMFWINYEDVAPMLAQQNVMTSSLNNVSSMSLDDYFTKGAYKGEIYKTVNLRNLAISQYCKDSTAVKKEQQKIEQQLKDFRTNLWNTKTVAELRQDSINAAIEAANDSIAEADNKEKKSKKVTRRARKEKETKVKKQEKQTKQKKQKENKSNGGAKVSVRRTRR